MHRTLPTLSGRATVGQCRRRCPGPRSLPSDTVVGGHLDSWDLGTGAIDDGAGVAITTAAAKHIMDAGRPLRTIRVVWFGAEEPGGFGGDARPRLTPVTATACRRKRLRRRPRLALQLEAYEDRARHLCPLAAALAPLGITKNDKGEGDGTESER